MELSNIIQNGVKIKDEGLVEILQALTKCFVIIGLRETSYPKNEETNVLIEFLKNHFGYLKTQEIEKAFEFAAAQKIQVDLNEYGKAFNSKLCGDVLNAYIEQARSKEIEKLNKERSEQPEPTEEEKRELIVRFYEIIVFPAFEVFLNDGVNHFTAHAKRIYPLMKKAELIEISEEDKKRLFAEHSKRIVELWNSTINKAATSFEENKYKDVLRRQLKDPEKKTLKKQTILSIKIELIEAVLRSNELETIKSKIIKAI